MSEYIDIDKFKQKIKELTLCHEIVVSEKGMKLAKIIHNSGWSERGRKSLSDIVSVLFAEKIPNLDICKNGKYPNGTMIVVLTNRNSHTYTIGEPVLVDNGSGRYGIKMNGNRGNQFSSSTDATRKATALEIDTFFKCFNYSCGMKHILNLICKLNT